MITMATDFLAWTTFGLAVATFALAIFAVLGLIEARRERRVTEKSLTIAQATLRAEQRPELIATSEHPGPERQVHLGSYGSVTKLWGTVRVSVEIHDGQVGLVSFEGNYSGGRRLGEGGSGA